MLNLYCKKGTFKCICLTDDLNLSLFRGRAYEHPKKSHQDLFSVRSYFQGNMVDLSTRAPSSLFMVL